MTILQKYDVPEAIVALLRSATAGEALQTPVGVKAGAADRAGRLASAPIPKNLA